VVGLDLLAGEEEALEVLGDTAYSTGQVRADLAAAGHTLSPGRCARRSLAALPSTTLMPTRPPGP
jgi:hypothetical protein